VDGDNKLMGLTEEQEIKMYDGTIETKVIVAQILERLKDGDEKLKDCQKAISHLKIEHSLLKGRLGAFILGLTFLVSLLVNTILWAWSHLGGHK